MHISILFTISLLHPRPPHENFQMISRKSQPKQPEIGESGAGLFVAAPMCANYITECILFYSKILILNI